MKLRRYRDADATATRAVFQRAVRQLAVADYTAAQVDAWAPMVLTTLERNAWARARASAHTVVAIEEGEVVGFADLVGDELLDMLYVDPRCARRGIGSALIKEVVQLAQSRDATVLQTDASLTARPVFVRHGFVVVAEQTAVVRGVAMTKFKMRLALSNHNAQLETPAAETDAATTSLAWPVAPPDLTDGVLMLRGWAPADAGAVLAACQDPQIQRWMDVPVPFLPEHAAAFVGDDAEQKWSSRRGAPFAITMAKDDRVLGSCGLVAIDMTDLVAQVVWAVAPAARGQHVAQRAGRLLCDWALGDLGLARLEFYIEPDNAASRAVAERLGCQLEGLLRSKSLIRGTQRDFALYALLGDAS